MPRPKKRQEAKDLGKYLLAAFLAVAVVVLAYAVWGIAQKERRAREAVEDRTMELAVLTERKAVFEGNLAELATGRGQEATLRQNHGVAREGEEVIIVVPPDEGASGPPIPAWKRFLGWFGFW